MSDKTADRPRTPPVPFFTVRKRPRLAVRIGEEEDSWAPHVAVLGGDHGAIETLVPCTAIKPLEEQL